jgi:iron complex outermembrane receptor protein
MQYWNSSISQTYYGKDAGAWYSKVADYNALYGSSTLTAAQLAAGTQLLQASLNNDYLQNKMTPETKSSALFGQLNWHFSEKGTLTAGLRETYEVKTNATSSTATNFTTGAPITTTSLTGLETSLGATAAQITAVNDIQKGTLGVGASSLYPTKQGIAIKALSPSILLSPSYKLNDTTLLYATAATGQKSGSVQFDSSGNPLNVNPERTFDLEAGFKTVLNSNLLLNVNFYHTQVTNYQQTTSIYSAALTAQNGVPSYSSVLGNIPGIIAQGVEVDGAYSPTRNLAFSFGTELNDAYYSNWHTATCPSEITAFNSSPSLVCDNTGKQVAAAPKMIVTLGADYHRSLSTNFTGHAWWNGVYRSRQNFDGNLSSYGWQEAYSINDIGIGIASPHEKYEIGVVVKNIANTQYTTSINGAGSPQMSYDGIGDPRTIALTMHAKL